MRRLIDEDNQPGSPQHRLAELVRATPRIEPDPVQRQRILARVRWAPRSGRVRLRPAIVAILLLSGTAGAATAGRFWSLRPLVMPRSEVRPPSPPTPVAAATSPAPPAPVIPSFDAERLPHALAVAAITPPTADIARPPAKGSRVAAVRSEPASAAASAAFGPVGATVPVTSSSGSAPVAGGPVDRPHIDDAEDAAEVVEAIRALRSGGDAVRAGGLLSAYLRAHPHGVLAEDALAFSIEAAAARREPEAAANYGRRYLGQFPNGRFRAVALRAVQLSGP